MRRIYLILAIVSAWLQGQTCQAQRFFNLTADEVRIDSVVPRFSCAVPLGAAYEDSVYTVSIAYPEFIDMSPSDIARYKAIDGTPLPAMPQVLQRIVRDRKQGSLEVVFSPLVYREGRHQLLVSFMLKVEARPRSLAGGKVAKARLLAAAPTSSSASRYADHSVLAAGRWAKIQVSQTGVHQLTDQLIRQAGFSNLSQVRIYGYGGNLQNETLAEDDLVALDDLKEVPTCTVGGRRLFYAKGPVSWSRKEANRRTRNPYSNYGCYFITEGDATPASCTEEEFLASFYDSDYTFYHSLYEVDGYAWYHGGRNLSDPTAIPLGESKTVALERNPQATHGWLSVNATAATASRVEVSLNGEVLGTLNITLGAYDKAGEQSASYYIEDIPEQFNVSFKTISGGPTRMDYASMAWNQPFPQPNLSGDAFPTPEYVYNVSNQDLHGDGPADMVIIIPTSQKLLTQAQRLQAFHQSHDTLRVRVVPADELFNEFSSGTPDANAYRRYLKMLYDRAETEADMPRYLLLFGDCFWDNRLLSPELRNLSPDDYLLCYESENSQNRVYCYVDDGFFCLLDDGEGGNPLSSDKLDVAVGRFPVSTADEAKVMVDKTIAYMQNKNAGAWENTIMFMGDDGNGNLHMRDVNNVADGLGRRYPGYQMKKVMWDAYTRETSSTGNTYPEATRIIKQQQQAGALIMDYAGHGREDQISHEAVLKLADFTAFTNSNLPLWITASCDIMPFDGTSSTIGEAAVLNAKGGAVAFFGTTRTVYADRNKTINEAFLRHVLSNDDGQPVTIGEAQRRAKNELIDTGSDLSVNKLQYSLLGDPALPLNLPTMRVVVDAINGVDVAQGGTTQMKAGAVVTVKGHIEGADDFRGVMSATVLDSEETITCKWNDRQEATEPFVYTDRTKVLFHGNDSVVGGQFEFSFAMPTDINYTDQTGKILIYAVDEAHVREANGASEAFTIGGSDIGGNDLVGPSIYCYLNSPSFVNGGNVNTTPFFVAQITDKDGINASGNGIGHDLELIVDGQMSRTYNLNDNFTYDFGTYTSGSTYYSIPELEPGDHQLLFRAWDVLNNSSVVELRFKVVKGLEPTLFSVSCTDNPATTTTTFIINHDRTGSDMDVELDVFDTSGRHLWHHAESGVSTDSAYTVTWDLTVDGGGRLQTGVYLYRVRVASDGSSKVSKAKKLVVIGNK